MSTAIDAVYAKLVADGRTAADLETLCRALPPRGEREAHHISVAVTISLAYRTQLEPAHKIQTCRSLAREIRACVGADGRYVALHGEPLELVSTRCDVITSELERRHGCDFYDLWEAAGGSVDRDGETDAYTRHMVAEVAKRCEAESARYCQHNPQC